MHRPSLSQYSLACDAGEDEGYDVLLSFQHAAPTTHTMAKGGKTTSLKKIVIDKDLAFESASRKGGTTGGNRGGIPQRGVRWGEIDFFFW
jgi:hypothetical protein